MQPHEFWQEAVPFGDLPSGAEYSDAYPARLADGRGLRLPIRPLADGEHALPSLILNQASFEVVETLASQLAARLAPFGPEVIVGLPTLGLTLAAAVARQLGHSRYVPLGTSRKFWYEERLSVPLSSITTPEQAKRLYIDPRMRPLLEARRVALIDDVISSGASIRSGLALLTLVGVEPVVIGAAMLQSERWRSALDEATVEKIRACFAAPLLRRTSAGTWVA